MTASTVNGAWLTSTNQDYLTRAFKVGVGCECVAATETIETTSVDEINDRVNMLAIPQGSKIACIWYSVTDMDSGGPTLSMDIMAAETSGGTLTETDLNTPSTFGQSATTGFLVPDAGGTWLHTCGATDDGTVTIRLKVTAAATTAAQGTVSLICWYR